MKLYSKQIQINNYRFGIVFGPVSFLVQDVRLGSTEAHQLSIDLDESIISGLLQQSQQPSASSLLSGSPPHSGRTSPPVTPSTAQHAHQQQAAFPHQQQHQQQSEPHQPQPQQQQLQSSQLQSSIQLQTQHEPMELQLEYWPIKAPLDKDKSQSKGFDQGKCSIKGTFRSLQVRYCRLSPPTPILTMPKMKMKKNAISMVYFQVCRLPLNPQSGEISQGLIVTYATKEKKQKSRFIHN